MFKNRQNKFVKGGWISRSVVTITMMVYRDYVLCVKRGKNVTQSDRWCMPCGYLDYNEDIETCAYREIHEETSLYMVDVAPVELVAIDSHPGTGRKQNVHFHYFMKVKGLLETDLSKVDRGEVVEIKWIHKNDLGNYEFAFGHDVRIIDYFRKRNPFIRLISHFGLW